MTIVSSDDPAVSRRRRAVAEALEGLGLSLSIDKHGHYEVLQLINERAWHVLALGMTWRDLTHWIAGHTADHVKSIDRAQRLEELEQWLMDKVDGGLECRGHDAVVTQHIELVRELRRAP